MSEKQKRTSRCNLCLGFLIAKHTAIFEEFFFDRDDLDGGHGLADVLDTVI